VLVDHRTYICKPGTAQAQLELYEKFGFGPQVRHIGPPIAYLVAESGALNTLVHLWAFENAGDRERKRAAMAADPEWKVYVRENRAAGHVVEQHTSLMIPASFAPLKR
jgi:hypothetical protein